MDGETPPDRSILLVGSIVTRRLADAVLVINGKVKVAAAGGEPSSLCQDAAAWLYDLLDDPPPNLADRLLKAANEVAAEISHGKASKMAG